MQSKLQCHPLQRRIGTWLLLSCCFIFAAFMLTACGGDDKKNKRVPVPVLTSVSPATANVGSAALTITAGGTGFVTSSLVQWNGTALTTTYGSATQLTAQVPASLLAAASTAQVTVINPPPGGGTSSAVPFIVGNAAPVVTGLAPTSALAGAAGFDLTVTGSNFISDSVVQWNGTPRSTRFVSSTWLVATIPASDLATAGTAEVRVVTPAPGGGTSPASTFTITPVSSRPTVTGLSPTGVVVGSAAIDLVVSGTGFVQGSTVLWGGADRVTTYVTSTSLRAAIPASDLTVERSVAVAVRNPAPGGEIGNSLYFVIAQPPVIAQEVSMISVAPDGSPPNGPSINGGMDRSGRYTIFASKASNLVPDDTNGAWDVFVHDGCTDYWGAPVVGCVPTTARISVASDGSQANGDSGDTASSDETSVAVSFDGRYVAFVSAASNLAAGDTNGVDDVYLRDTCLGARTACTPQTVRVSLRNDGTQASQAASKPAIGDDGNYVVFESADSGLVAGDTNGATDIFMRRLCFGQAAGCTPATLRVSVGPSGIEANAASHAAVFTGRYVAFTSSASNLVADDTNGAVDVFMHDTCVATVGCTPSTERISIATGGGQANGPSGEPLVGQPMSSASGYDYHGRFVVFTSSASNLVADDTNGVGDVFMRDTCRGYPGCIPSTQRVSLTASGGQITGQSSTQPGHMRWDGQLVLFVTAADNVVANDTNGVADVFARGICHDSPEYCVVTTTRVSHGPSGVQGNGASSTPRGNYDPWVGPEYVTFFSTATTFLTGPVPTPYYGAIFRAGAR